jgi:hypothetical protein
MSFAYISLRTCRRSIIALPISKSNWLIQILNGPRRSSFTMLGGWVSWWITSIRLITGISSLTFKRRHFVLRSWGISTLRNSWISRILFKTLALRMMPATGEKRKMIIMIKTTIWFYSPLWVMTQMTHSTTGPLPSAKMAQWYSWRTQTYSNFRNLERTPTFRFNSRKMSWTGAQSKKLP